MRVEGLTAPAAARAHPTLAFPRRHPEDTPLHRAVRENLETFLSRAELSGRSVPRFVARELRAYLECGLLPFGFLRSRCGQSGFCPSCVGRRMADTAAHLVDRLVPEVPVRQWVLSLPWGLRLRMAYDPEGPLRESSLLDEARRQRRLTWRASRRIGAREEASSCPEATALVRRSSTGAPLIAVSSLQR